MTPEAGSGRSLKAQAIIATRWTVVRALAVKLIGFFTTVCLARALLPEEFGVIAILTLSLTAGTLCQEFGTAAGVVYRREEEQTAGFILLFQMSVGVLLVLATLYTATWIGEFFRQPSLEPTLRVLSAGYLLTPLLAIPIARLEKALDYGAKTAVELAGAVAQNGVMVTLAFLGWGAWSFVWGVLVGKALAAGLVWAARWKPISFTFSARTARETLGYGRYVYGEGMLWFLSVNIDDLLVGRLLGTGALGVYNLGFSTAVTPANAIGAVTQVTFPVFSRIRDDAAMLKRAFLRSTEYCLMVGIPLLSLLALLAHPVIVTLYGDKWVEAVPVLRVLAPYAALWIAALMVSDLFKAVGLVRVLFWINAARVVLLVAGVLVGVRYGITGVAVAVLTVGLLTRVLQFYWVSRVLELRTGDYAATCGPAVVAAAAMLTIVLPLRAGLPPLVPALDLVTHAGVGAAVYVAVLCLLRWQRLLELFGLLRAATFGREG